MRAGYAGEDCPKVSVMLELIGYAELSSHRKSDSNMVKDSLIKAYKTCF